MATNTTTAKSGLLSRVGTGLAAFGAGGTSMSIVFDLMKETLGQRTAENPERLYGLMMTYPLIEGWHIFSCNELPGFWVADMDFDAAYDSVSQALEQYVADRCNVLCKVTAPNETAAVRVLH